MKVTGLVGVLVGVIGLCAIAALPQPPSLARVGGRAPLQSPTIKRVERKQQAVSSRLRSADNESRPWVFWYWMQGAVSEKGITADLEAMKKIGVGGAYLMPIKGPANPPVYTPASVQLSPEWWQKVKFAFREADRLKLKLGMHVSDGFALAGGPWITPELSMQKVVWTKTQVEGGKSPGILPQPETKENYYRDIAVFAYPSPEGSGISTGTVVPKITTSTGADASFLVKEGTKEAFRSDVACWVQYEFEKPFTCRTVAIRTNGNNVQAHRLLIRVSNDGVNFKDHTRLEPPRHGWQDTDADVTHSIVPVSARYYRFVYDKEGSEPGSEDLDNAKWKPSLKLVNVDLFSEATINQFESKNGEVWRVSKRSTAESISDTLCVPREKILDLTPFLKTNGTLDWTAPGGSWTVIRMGHTSTGHRNDTGGGGIGLECDKFNPAAVRVQFDKWYGEAIRQIGPQLTKNVLSTFHVDSWECGSQNWSTGFRGEFKERRGYDLQPYLPAMAGVPVASAEMTERFLYDVRRTIADLVSDKFYKTLSGLAKEKGVAFSAEAIAPTMVSDGLLHYQSVDKPMGEFWVNSPTHDKPNDMLDAISGAHIYGKNIVQAEAFTTVRMDWSEHPGSLKKIQDRNYALGINKLVYHVFAHNPWMDRKPGMTLDGVGLYFQRDQTWWDAAKAWVDYAIRCQQKLQQGLPVADLAVFTGEEVPRRAVLPDRLLAVLPGLFGPDAVAAERKRLANVDVPMRQLPVGVSNQANTFDASALVNPLRGYNYDSVNPDALMHASVSNGDILLPGGARYKVLVLPGITKLDPSGTMSEAIAGKLLALIEAGARVIVPPFPPKGPPGNPGSGTPVLNRFVKSCWPQYWSEVKGENGIYVNDVGKGRTIKAPFLEETLSQLGIRRDLVVSDPSGRYAEGIAFAHRRTLNIDTYFISNQEDEERTLRFDFRVGKGEPIIYDPVAGLTNRNPTYTVPDKGLRRISLTLPANGSLFVDFVVPGKVVARKNNVSEEFKPIMALPGSWTVSFDTAAGGPASPVAFGSLADWSRHADSLIRYYSGTAVYKTSFTWSKSLGASGPDGLSGGLFLDLGKVANIATVKINGIPVDTLWTPPYRTNITRFVRKGVNSLEVAVTNTWRNRLIGDQRVPSEKRITNTTAPYRLQNQPLLEAGLLGPVTFQVLRNQP